MQEIKFVHLHFFGETTAPWTITKKRYSSYVYSYNFLWGRAVRGPILNYILQSFCPHLPNAMLPCCECSNYSECPFFNLNGSEKSGDFKDTPKFVVTSLTFRTFDMRRLKLTSINILGNSNNSQGIVNVEYIPIGTNFEFEVILTGDASKFVNYVIEGARATLTLVGWGARCTEGYGRGKIIKVDRQSFTEWLQYVDKKTNTYEGKTTASLRAFPMLILSKEEARPTIYTSIFERNFANKLANSMNERYWQFTKLNHHLNIKNVSGNCTFTRVRSWSRRDNCSDLFGGLSGDLFLEFTAPLTASEARIIGISWYGIGSYKNQGFGSLREI